MFTGKKKSHKGGHRHFTNEDQLAAEKAREEKQREWRVSAHINKTLKGRCFFTSLTPTIFSKMVQLNVLVQM